MVEDVAVEVVVVAELRLAMFVVAEVAAASPVEAAMVAEVEALVVDLVVMVVVHLHMEAELHPMAVAAEEVTEEAMATQGAPPTVHLPGGKVSDIDTAPFDPSQITFLFSFQPGALRQRLQTR